MSFLSSTSYSGSPKKNLKYGKPQKQYLYNKQNQAYYYGVVDKSRPHGEGQILHQDGKTKQYCGTFKYGVLNNYVEEFSILGNLIYKGTFQQGEKNGQGYAYYETGELFYKGNYQNHSFQGLGEQFFQDPMNIQQYKGEFYEGQPHGWGIQYFSDGKILYEGQFVEGQPQGIGTKFSDELLKPYHSKKQKKIYEGEWYMGLPYGEGKAYSPKLIGEYQQQILYEGRLQGGVKHGLGKVYNSQSGFLVYEGNWDNDVQQGQGKLFNESNGQLFYEGNVENGIGQGIGKLFNKNNKLIYQGGIKDNLSHGYGIGFNEKNGKKQQEGYWTMGKITLIAQKHIKLYNGCEMPVLGLGTWKSPADKTREAVISAVKSGYRMIDCANDYGNEHVIGDTLQELYNEGVVKREDMFLQAKLWNTNHRPEHVKEDLIATLKDLKTDYIDNFVIHWPQACPATGKKATLRVDGNHHAHHSEPSMFPLNEEGYFCSDNDSHYIETWHAMEALVDEGLAKSIGLNAKCPPGGYELLEHPELIKIGEKYKKSVAQVVLRWHLQFGGSVVPKSVTPSRIAENIEVFDFELSPEDIKFFESLNLGWRHLLWVETAGHPDYPFKDELPHKFQVPKSSGCTSKSSRD